MVLVKYPTCLWNIYNSLTLQSWADNNNVTFLDFNADEVLRNELNIDWNTESLDGGNHLNYDGAMKVSDWIGKYLADNYHFSDKRNDPQYNIWETDYNYYKKCVSNHQISSIVEFEEYLNTLDAGGYIVILTIDCINMSSWPDTYNRLLLSGVPENVLSSPLMNANICIFNTESHEVIYEAVDNKTFYYNNNVEGFMLRITCTLQDGMQTFSCICDRQETARDQDGLQFIVLDPLTNIYIDTSVWLVSEVGDFSRFS